ncbi:MAG: hypothetical protein K1X79_08735 [Oligoflexia bacterium]|nr:hypothetical protein [Oligoflexia bacterium]
MGRPIYPYELTDPDLAWLVQNFQENNPAYALVDNACLPVVLIKISENKAPSYLPATVPDADGDDDGVTSNKD